MALTGEKLERMIGQSRKKVTDLYAQDPDKVTSIDKTLDIDFDEHFAFQNQQAEAHAMGVLTPEAATIVYNALGHNYSSSNGGWSRDTDTATKFLVTQLMSELLEMSIKRRKVTSGTR